MNPPSMNPDLPQMVLALLANATNVRRCCIALVDAQNPDGIQALTLAAIDSTLFSLVVAPSLAAAKIDLLHIKRGP